MKGLSITGRKQQTEYDFYETPEWATERAIDAMLLDGILKKDDNIYECCCGAGAITKVLQRKGFQNVRESDIQNESYISGEKGIDVYDIKANFCSVVLTNPPYDQMTKHNMLQEFLRISSDKVILLLNIFFLSSKDRKTMLEKSHLRHIYIHSDRVTMYPYGMEKPKNGGTKMFAWYVFDKNYNSMPTLSWI